MICGRVTYTLRRHNSNRAQPERTVMSGAVTNQLQQRDTRIRASVWLDRRAGYAYNCRPYCMRPDKYKWPSRSLIIYRDFLRPKLAATPNGVVSAGTRYSSVHHPSRPAAHARTPPRTPPQTNTSLFTTK